VPNPEKDWGPMQRAPGFATNEHGVHDTRVAKRQRNQGKHSDKAPDSKKSRDADSAPEAVLTLPTAAPVKEGENFFTRFPVLTTVLKTLSLCTLF
jgi:hypothetical protein